MTRTGNSPSVANAGKVVSQINVSIGPQFLNLFSEQLYSSPNKAFEELVANSWDAGATVVYVSVSKGLSADSAIVWVLDNGESMDLDGLAALWNVATSPKGRISPTNGRLQIGKFGIGKLATYVLTNELTYICRASDGVIRAVTMDYRRIDQAGEDGSRLHIDPLRLDVREIDIEELHELLSTFPAETNIWKLIDSGVPGLPDDTEWQNEYGGEDPSPPQTRGTWTLALLSSLKPTGRKMQTGWIRRLLRTALPLGSSISIVFNDELLTSSKIDTEIAEGWEIGPDLGIESIELPNYFTEEGEIVSGETRKITEHAEPYPHITIEGMSGVITGRMRLYGDKISGGKSEAIGHSNGFFVNILGRVINPTDPYFGLKSQPFCVG